MSNRNKPPVIKVNPVPGKVSTKLFSVDISVPASKSTEVKITNKVMLKKDSGQKVRESLSVKYRLPYIDPEFVKDCYEGSPEHTRCLKFKANCIIGAGLQIEPIDPGLKDYTGDSEYKLLNDFITKPVNGNDEFLIDVLKSAEEDYLNYGFGLIELVKNRKGELAELYYFPSYEARIVLDQKAKGAMGDKISIIQLLTTTEAARFPLFSEKNFKEYDSTVMLIRNINPFDRFYGFPEWYPATAKLALARSIDEYNIRSFKNDLMISFVIVVEGGELATGQDEAIKNFLQANYKGVQNASRALMLQSDNPDVKIHIEKVQKDGREGSFQATQNNAIDSIVISHGVVGSLLGISKPGKLGNTSENYDLFRVMNETVIKPEQTKIAAKINNIINIGLGITKFKLVPKELSFEKITELVDFLTKLGGGGYIDENEVRQGAGYEARVENPGSLLDKVNTLQKSVRILKQHIDKQDV